MSKLEKLAAALRAKRAEYEKLNLVAIAKEDEAREANDAMYSALGDMKDLEAEVLAAAIDTERLIRER